MHTNVHQTHALQLLAFLHLRASSTYTFMQFLFCETHQIFMLGAIYLQTSEHPAGADKEVAKITNARFLFIQLQSASPPTVRNRNLMSPRLSHVGLDKPLTASLQRDCSVRSDIKLLPLNTSHASSLVEKLECVIRRTGFDSRPV